MSTLTVVDFSEGDCWKPGTSSWLSARKDVCYALEEHGCFVAMMPDKVSLELHNTIFSALKDLFNFPTELKAKNRYDGKMKLGHCSYSFGHEGLGIMNPSNIEDIQNFTHLFWPNGNDQFREAAYTYEKLISQLDHAVTKMVFENYGVEKYHDDHKQSTFHVVQFAKYKELKQSENHMAIHAHTDKDFNTILHQNMCGLEINTNDEEWISIDLHPSSFVFIAGDMFKIWSNGRIKSCVHRINMKGNDEPRYSFGFCYMKEGVTNTPEEFLDEDHPLRYKAMDQIEYIDLYRYRGGLGSLEEYCGI